MPRGRTCQRRSSRHRRLGAIVSLPQLTHTNDRVESPGVVHRSDTHPTDALRTRFPNDGRGTLDLASQGWGHHAWNSSFKQGARCSSSALFSDRITDMATPNRQNARSRPRRPAVVRLSEPRLARCGCSPCRIRLHRRSRATRGPSIGHSRRAGVVRPERGTPTAALFKERRELTAIADNADRHATVDKSSARAGGRGDWPLMATRG